MPRKLYDTPCVILTRGNLDTCLQSPELLDCTVKCDGDENENDHDDDNDNDDDHGDKRSLLAGNCFEISGRAPAYVAAWCCTGNPDGVIAAEATRSFHGGYCYGPAALRCTPHSHTGPTIPYDVHIPYILIRGGFHYVGFITGGLHSRDKSELSFLLKQLPFLLHIADEADETD
ncbi:hypothetical protein ALC62_13238 [Cyphomyrmex costatus]|uniref:Uncharacterized protein n=1 Tax=Cyphomyrmex costatus TaxID=456900 RepID=A0A195C7P5_9HYME|nr:hypothetical protein ALC62_13238 [Cyphomyrmex costatus]